MNHHLIALYRWLGKSCWFFGERDDGHQRSISRTNRRRRLKIARKSLLVFKWHVESYCYCSWVDKEWRKKKEENWKHAAYVRGCSSIMFYIMLSVLKPPALFMSFILYEWSNVILLFFCHFFFGLLHFATVFGSRSVTAALFP